jgi:hypothetical protein
MLLLLPSDSFSEAYFAWLNAVVNACAVFWLSSSTYLIRCNNILYDDDDDECVASTYSMSMYLLCTNARNILFNVFL